MILSTGVVAPTKLAPSPNYERRTSQAVDA
jgi:hypothetical protein